MAAMKRFSALRRGWWWMAVLFAVGSACFIVAPIPAYLDLVGPQADAATYFVGSLFFTSAALVQLVLASRARRTPHDGAGRVDWWASAIQLVGTVFFNATTFRALSEAIDSPSYDRLVWRPDALGSICFLASGVMAYHLVAGGIAHRPPRNIDGAIAGVNLLGCVAFGLSALAAYVVPATQEELDATVANVTTALGALAFLIGALLLFPQQRRATEPLVAHPQ